MKIRNKSFQDIFTLFPKTTSHNSTKTNYFQTKKYNLFRKTVSNSFLFSNGSSTFDFMNDINNDKFNKPKLKPPFLTKSKRNIKIHKNILNKIKHRKKILNSLHKHKLSESCELFYKLDKAYMTDKNSLMNTNTLKFIFKENDNVYDEEDKEKKISHKNIFRKIFVKNKEKNVINLKIHRKDEKEIIYNKKTNSNNINENENNINFIYNRIFPKIFVSHNSDYNVIDNKLNLLYAEDENHFNYKLILKNKFLRDSGQKMRKMVLDHHYATDKLNEVKKKIGFIKGITDFSYPDIILQKSKIKFGTNNFKNRKVKKFKLPYQIITEEKKRDNLMKTKSLSEAILINGRKNINKSY